MTKNELVSLTKENAINIREKGKGIKYPKDFCSNIVHLSKHYTSNEIAGLIGIPKSSVRSILDRYKGRGTQDNETFNFINLNSLNHNVDNRKSFMKLTTKTGTVIEFFE